MKAEKVYEIAKKVYDEYPVKRKEKVCAAAATKREMLRAERTKRYVDEENEREKLTVKNES